MENNDGNKAKQIPGDINIYLEEERKVHIKGEDVESKELNFQMGLFITQKSKPNRIRWFPIWHIIELDMPGKLELVTVDKKTGRTIITPTGFGTRLGGGGKR